MELMRWQQWQALGARLKDKCNCGGSGARGPPPPLRPAMAASTSLLQQGGLPLFGSLHFERTAAMQPGAGLTRRFMSSHPIVLQVGVE